MTRYMLTPITAFEDPSQCFGSLEEAKRRALENTEKFSDLADGWVVCEVREVGRYEKVTPIWSSASEQQAYPNPQGKDAAAAAEQFATTMARQP